MPVFRDIKILLTGRKLLESLPKDSYYAWPKIKLIWHSAPGVYGRAFCLEGRKMFEFEVLEKLIEASNAENLLRAGLNENSANVVGYSLLGLFLLDSEIFDGEYKIRDGQRIIEFLHFPGKTFSLDDFFAHLRELRVKEAVQEAKFFEIHFRIEEVGE